VSGLLAAPLLLFMEPLLDFFDDDFVHGATVARILVVAQLFAAAAGPQQHVLIMTGHERPATLVMAAGTGINIVGCLIGIAFFGATGAALATMASIVFCNVALAITIYRRLDLMPGLMAFADRWRSRSAKPVAAE
jgi:O-antigen/teichoic acid export membrane protein